MIYSLDSWIACFILFQIDPRFYLNSLFVLFSWNLRHDLKGRTLCDLRAPPSISSCFKRRIYSFRFVWPLILLEYPLLLLSALFFCSLFSCLFMFSSDYHLVNSNYKVLFPSQLLPKCILRRLHCVAYPLAQLLNCKKHWLVPSIQIITSIHDMNFVYKNIGVMWNTLVCTSLLKLPLVSNHLLLICVTCIVGAWHIMYTCLKTEWGLRILKLFV